MQSPEISIILPCRNEEQALPSVLKQIKETINKNNLNAEIIVSDSSTDKSPEIAKKLNAVLVKHDKKGYGVAYLEGFKKAKGKYLFLADADGTYDFKEIPKFISYLNQGYDLVIGNRFKGEMHKKAMPWSHRYIGNPVLSSITRLFFRTEVKDVHCGMRAITRQALDQLNLKTPGMEFASEMIMKAKKENLKIKQIPINYHERKGDSKLRTFPDGWRHLRFMLLNSPLFLFLIPGLILFTLGLSSMLWFYIWSPKILGVKLFYHPMFLSSVSLIVGYQAIIFSTFTKTYLITHLGEKSETMNRLYKHITLEKAGILGLLLIISGTIIYLLIFTSWLKSGFGSLSQAKNAIIGLTLITLGFQTIFSGFMLSILSIKEQ